MCTRMTQTTPAEELARQFGVGGAFELAPNYNLAPTDPVPIYRLGEVEPEIVVVRWGLVPFWSKDLSGGARMVNARVETVAQKPSFKESFEKRRCLVLADGFYEWKKEGDIKQPYYFKRLDGLPLAMAGLWARWRPKDAPDAVPIDSCTVITLEAKPPFSRIHTRMPAVLSQENQKRWLSSLDLASLEAIAREADEVVGPAFESFPVSTFMNNVRHEGPRCIEPLTVKPSQKTLF